MKGYSILLVDDEEIALMGAEKGVNWESLGITKCYCAAGIKDALGVLKKIGRAHV